VTTTTSQVRSVINDLYDRIAIAGVAVFRYTPSPRDIEHADEWLVIANSVTGGSQTFPFLSTAIKDEEFTLNGQVFVSMSGAGDAVAERALSRAEEIAGVIEAALQPDPTIERSQPTDTIEYSGFEHRFGGDNEHRMHQLDFTLLCKVRLIST
jgi:hypothetical protein